DRLVARRVSHPGDAGHEPTGCGRADSGATDRVRRPDRSRRRASPRDLGDGVRVARPARARRASAGRSAMRRACALLTVLVIALALGPRLSAYLRFGVQIGSRVILLKWNDLPVRYFITNRDVPGVTAPQLSTAVASAFATWSSVPTVKLSSQFVGFVGSDPANNDGINVIGFLFQPDLDRVLGATTHNVDGVTGAIIESDIFLNSAFAWSVAPTGESKRFDVQSIATHEIGHLLGLGHSALGETELQPDGGRRVLGKSAVMFPIAFPAGNIADRVLKPDDIAGISGTYPTPEFSTQLGSISVRVTLTNNVL